MSLNSIVNNLVRAAASVPSNISDTDLDAHVAQLLADEAKARDKKWSDLGLRAFLSEDSSSPDPNAPRPNKRFLASVIRTVDGHNAALLRQQAAAARDARIERGDERPDVGPSRRSAFGPGRLFGGAMRDAAGPTARNGRSRDEASKRRMRAWSDEDDSRDPPKRSTRGAEREEGHRSRRRYDYSDDDDDHSRRATRTARDEDSPRRTSRHRYDDTKDDNYDGARRKSKRDEHDPSPDRRRHRDHDSDTRHRSRRDEDKDALKRTRRRTLDHDHRSRRHSKSRSRSPKRPSQSSLPPPPPPADRPPPAPSESDLSPSPPPAPLSKMDKYFTSSYNPVLDVGEVPKEGMITAVGWDNMLAILQERGKKRRQRSPGLFDDPVEIPKVSLRRSPSPSSDALRRLEKEERRARKEARRRRRAADEDSEDELAREKRRKERKAADMGPDMFSTDYVKQGGVREWDKGK